MKVLSVTIWLALAASVVCAACGESDPMLPDVGEPRVFGDHSEVDITFESADGALLAGTLYMPLGPGPFAAAAVSQGSSWTVRATFDEAAVFVLGLGEAAFSYDKRGQGQSGGTCCPADGGETFDLLADDLVAAARALREVPQIDATKIGVFGSSQGGWVVPLAANKGRGDVHFAIVTVGGAVSSGQEGLYDMLTGYDVCERTSTSMSDIIAQLEAVGPSDFDPRQSIEELAQPTIWVFGENDFSHPTQLAVSVLADVKQALQKEWTVVVLPGANHDLIENGSICQVDGPLADVLTPISQWFADVVR